MFESMAAVHVCPCPPVSAQLTALPREIGNCSQLTSLSLGFNFLRGPVPPELGQVRPPLPPAPCSVLHARALWFSGSLALSFWLSLALSFCLFLALSASLSAHAHAHAHTQRVPPSRCFGRGPPRQLRRLEGLYLENNYLNGTVPEQLGALGSTLLGCSLASWKLKSLRSGRWHTKNARIF